MLILLCIDGMGLDFIPMPVHNQELKEQFPYSLGLKFKAQNLDEGWW